MNAKPTIILMGVVKQDNTAVREFGPPGFEVVLYVLIKVATVNVQQIDGVVLKPVKGFVKSALNQLRKICIQRIVLLP